MNISITPDPIFSKPIHLPSFASFLYQNISYKPSTQIWIQPSPPNSYYISTTDLKLAKALEKLSGIRFLKSKLTIRLDTGSNDIHSDSSMTGISNSLSITETFKLFIASRYNPNLKYLNLDSVMSDPSISNLHIDIFNHHSSHLLGPAICKLILSICPNVETISLASNNLKTLSIFSELPLRLPNILNLSFKDNNISFLKDIECFPGKDLVRLKELILLGNPIVSRELSKPKGDLRYKNIITKIFPSIQVLDMQSVMITFPRTVKEGFIESEQGLVYDFMLKFFTTFDQNRPALLDLYSDQAYFSLSINPFLQQSIPNVDMNFSTWWPFNRNLKRLKVSDKNKRAQVLKIGNTEIIKLFNSLPATTHAIHETREQKTFLIESIMLKPIPITRVAIFIHGEFTDGDRNTKRSFDRTFIITPSIAGSRAAMAGIPYTVINDQLVLRPHHGNSEWVNAISLREEIDLNQTQLNILETFQKSTRLNREFSLQCLTETNWDLQQAHAAFLAAKDKLPQSAYMQ